ncbi:hypothetical protein [Novosphingobium panipatense]|uniref:hypothetical protein n=1 Tax=Novosphingobium panipatense TaxID=428991 RepID=UPI00360BBFBB
MFLLPLLRAAAGAARVLPIRCKARIAAPLRQNGHRREFLRGTWDGEFVCPNPLQDSGALSSLAASNALIDRLPLAEAAVPGTTSMSSCWRVPVRCENGCNSLLACSPNVH